MKVVNTLQAQYSLGRNIDLCRRWRALPGTLRDRIVAVDHFKNEVDQWDLHEILIQESLGPVVDPGRDEYYLSMLLNSDASQPLELDLGFGAFRRPNQPGLITLAEPRKVQNIQGLGPFHSLAFYAEKSTFDRRLRDIAGRDDISLEALYHGIIADRALQILFTRLMAAARSGEHFLQEEMLDGICVRLLNLAGERPSHSIRDRRLSPQSISRVTEFITEHYSTPLTRKRLAEVAGVSAPYFSRLFLRAMGQTPQEFIRKIRVEKAQHLMLSAPAEIPIAQIAVSCGFTDRSHLAREFRRTFGLSPGMYRRGV